MDRLAPFRISVCGIEELEGHCETGVSHVLSILDPDWPVPEAFGAFGEHVKLELRFHDVIEADLPGRIHPTRQDVMDVLALGQTLLAEPPSDAHLLVHCHAGVSRSTASIAVILAQALPDVPAERIFAHILEVRPQAWPNLRILELGDDILGRSDLARAAGAIYRRQLDRGEQLAEVMRANQRGREVEAAVRAGRSV
ncbi:MAG: protein-tyrosine-phosphatase [Proteobacteria bacterium]|nr:protein-tyrosine-phosphatase [Pseudomonadota bacterium]